jgi:hypothetical protein
MANSMRSHRRSELARHPQPQLSGQLGHPTYRLILLTLILLEPAGNMYTQAHTAESTVMVYAIYDVATPG